MYSFEPTDEQKIVATAAKKLAVKEFRSRMRDADEASEPAPEWMQSGWELGLLPASIPEEFGDSVSTRTDMDLAAEELAWGRSQRHACPCLPESGCTAGFACDGWPERASAAFLQNSSSTAQPHLWNPILVLTNCLKTVATKKDGKYHLSGTSVMYRLLQNPNGWLSLPEGQCQGFLAAKGSGVAIKEREQNMGMNAFPMYAVELRECEIPAGQRLGGGAGCDYQLLLNSSRVALSSMAVGVARASHEYALDYAKHRKAFGEAIAQRQSIAFTLAEINTDIDAARLLV
jgi:alkylation response protein AidB-like acyl-CoA dehydrogenase